MADEGARKRPAYQWYPGDWRRDTPLQSCSWDARALWRDLLDLMHDGDPYGHLAVNGRPIPLERVAAMIGLPMARAQRYLVELEEAGVSSRTPDGVLFSRRMVRDERVRNLRAAGGPKSLDHPNVPKPREEGPGVRIPSAPPSPPSSPGSIGGSPAVAVAVAVAGSSERSQTEDKSQEEPPSVDSPKNSESTAVAAAEVGTLTRRGRHPRLSAVVEHFGGMAVEGLARMGREQRREVLVEMVFAYHAMKTGLRTAVLDDKRAARLRTRLTENGDDVSELLYASDGARKDRHLSGENDRGRKYLGFQTVFRDREQVERLAVLGGYMPQKVHPLAAKWLAEAEASNGAVAD